MLAGHGLGQLSRNSQEHMLIKPWVETSTFNEQNSSYLSTYLFQHILQSKYTPQHERVYIRVLIHAGITKSQRLGDLHSKNSLLIDWEARIPRSACQPIQSPGKNSLPDLQTAGRLLAGATRQREREARSLVALLIKPQSHHEDPTFIPS